MLVLRDRIRGLCGSLGTGTVALLRLSVLPLKVELSDMLRDVPAALTSQRSLGVTLVSPYFAARVLEPVLDHGRTNARIIMEFHSIFISYAARQQLLLHL